MGVSESAISEHRLFTIEDINIEEGRDSNEDDDSDRLPRILLNVNLENVKEFFEEPAWAIITNHGKSHLNSPI